MSAVRAASKVRVASFARRAPGRAVSRNKDLMGCGMARDPERSPVPPRERLLGLRLPHGSS